MRLAQQLSEAGPSDGHSGETNQAGLVQLRKETRELQQRVNDMSARLAEVEEALQLAQRRAKQAEEYVQTLESDRERAREEAELNCLCAVAEETEKWDQREARIIQRIEELAHSLTGTTVGGGLGVAISPAPRLLSLVCTSRLPPRPPTHTMSPTAVIS